MNKILIFGGTTEGRELAQWCGENGIAADVSVTTDYGARLLGNDRLINIFTGKLDSGEMETLIKAGNYAAVIDATHPYALEATENIRSACIAEKKPCYRLLREQSEPSGTVVSSIGEAVELLNRPEMSEKILLSTLGSKELPELAGIRDCKRRVWLRVLPAEGIEEHCAGFGFDRGHIITGRGPFSVEDNKRHIKQSRARILITKESGKAGGYPEKLAAARELGIETITIARPTEKGYLFTELIKLIGELA